MSTNGLSLYRACARRLSGLGLRKFAIVNRVNDWILDQVKPRQAIVNGHVMHLDQHDSLDLSLNQMYEPLETELIGRLVKEGDTVLDIGANIGYYTLLLARRVGNNGRVFAFEPDPENFGLLERNVKCNGYRNVTLINAAASDKAGTAKLYLCDKNRGDHRIYPSADYRRTVQIKTMEVDEYLGPQSRDVRFVKMDVQGAEGRVLSGLEKTLRNSGAFQIILEFWPQGLHRAGNDPRKVLNLLTIHGFKLQMLDEQQRKLVSVEPEIVLEEYTIEKGNQTNLLASKVLGVDSVLVNQPKEAR